MERIQKLKGMLESSPTDCFLLHALGLEYVKLNEPGIAVDYFKKVISIDENYVGTYYHLAKTIQKMENMDEAIEWYEKGILIATQLKDQHAKNELQMALEELTDG